MKQHEIAACAVCKKGVMHDNHVTFFRVRVEHLVVDLRAVQRQHGLEQLLGGNAAIAHAMGPDEDMAKTASDKAGLVCQSCMLVAPAAQVWEALT